MRFYIISVGLGSAHPVFVLQYDGAYLKTFFERCQSLTFSSARFLSFVFLVQISFQYSSFEVHV